VEDKITSLLVENGSDSLTGIAVTADDENGIQLQVLQ
jgi:ATP-dependent Clp protease ATP-binding subunit ClpC